MAASAAAQPASFESMAVNLTDGRPLGGVGTVRQVDRIL